MSRFLRRSQMSGPITRHVQRAGGAEQGRRADLPPREIGHGFIVDRTAFPQPFAQGGGGWIIVIAGARAREGAYARSAGSEPRADCLLGGRRAWRGLTPCGGRTDRGNAIGSKQPSETSGQSGGNPSGIVDQAHRYDEVPDGTKAWERSSTQTAKAMIRYRKQMPYKPACRLRNILLFSFSESALDRQSVQ
jgi:hypothetical protein